MTRYCLHDVALPFSRETRVSTQFRSLSRSRNERNTERRNHFNITQLTIINSRNWMINGLVKQWQLFETDISHLNKHWFYTTYIHISSRNVLILNLNTYLQSFYNQFLNYYYINSICLILSRIIRMTS